MRDSQDRTLERLQSGFQHLNGSKVQVIRWLIQQQEIGVDQQQVGQLQAALLASTQTLNGRANILVGKEQTTQKGDSLWLGHWLDVAHKINRRAIKRQYLSSF